MLATPSTIMWTATSATTYTYARWIAVCPRDAGIATALIEATS
jgi:hypothetical protein